MAKTTKIIILSAFKQTFEVARTGQNVTTLQKKGRFPRRCRRTYATQRTLVIKQVQAHIHAVHSRAFTRLNMQLVEVGNFDITRARESERETVA